MRRVGTCAAAQTRGHYMHHTIYAARKSVRVACGLKADQAMRLTASGLCLALQSGPRTRSVAWATRRLPVVTALFCSVLNVARIMMHAAYEYSLGAVTRRNTALPLPHAPRPPLVADERMIHVKPKSHPSLIHRCLALEPRNLLLVKELFKARCPWRAIVRIRIGRLDLKS